MKKQILAAFITLASVSISFAQARPPMLFGDAVLKDELIILNKTVVCSAWGAPTPVGGAKTKPEDLFYGTFTVAMAQEDGSILVDGYIDGESFEISGNPKGSMDISLSAKAEPGKLPAYNFSSGGSFTNLVVHNTPVKNVGLDVMMNGKSKHIGCSLKE